MLTNAGAEPPAQLRVLAALLRLALLDERECRRRRQRLAHREHPLVAGAVYSGVGFQDSRPGFRAAGVGCFLLRVWGQGFVPGVWGQGGPGFRASGCGMGAGAGVGGNVDNDDSASHTESTHSSQVHSNFFLMSHCSHGIGAVSFVSAEEAPLSYCSE